MRKFIRSFRRARIYANQYGGGYVFWDWVAKTWKPIPCPRKPNYHDMWLIERTEPFYNYLTKLK